MIFCGEGPDLVTHPLITHTIGPTSLTQIQGRIQGSSEQLNQKGTSDMNAVTIRLGEVENANSKPFWSIRHAR